MKSHRQQTQEYKVTSRSDPIGNQRKTRPGRFRLPVIAQVALAGWLADRSVWLTECNIRVTSAAEPDPTVEHQLVAAPPLHSCSLAIKTHGTAPPPPDPPPAATYPSTRAYPSATRSASVR